jgi:hypothetical protein
MFFVFLIRYHTLFAKKFLLKLNSNNNNVVRHNMVGPNSPVNRGLGRYGSIFNKNSNSKRGVKRKIIKI